MRKTNKRGFTIVELVIVIAVIAILAAVLIPTFTNLVKKANVTADTQLVRNLNTALTVENQDYPTMHDALEVVKEAGYDVAKITASDKGNAILWDSVNQVFCYLKKDATVPTYIPDTTLTNKSVKDVDYWRITDDDKYLKDEAKYSVYYTGTKTAIETTVGFDAGTTSGITSVNYSNANSGQTVVIRTNSFATTVNVNGESDNVKHYGEAKEVNVIKVAMASYHEFGSINGNINIAYGRVELESGSSISNVIVKALDGVEPTAGSVKVTVANGAKATLILSDVSGVTATVDGEGAGDVAVLESTTDKIAAIGSTMYDTLKKAISAAKSGETVTLLNDATITAILVNGSYSISKDITIDLNGKKLSTVRLDVSSGKNVTVKNGEVVSTSSTGGGIGFQVKANAGLTLSQVLYSGACYGIYPSGDASYVNVLNSSIRTIAGIATNANGTLSNNVKITIESSTIDCTEIAAWINVPGSFSINNSVLKGGAQALMVRAGTAVVSNSQLILHKGDNGQTLDADNHLSGSNVWGQGNDVPCGALIVGDYSNSYNCTASCTLINTQVSTTYEDFSRKLIVLSQDGENETILNYDSACGIAGSDYIICDYAVDGLKKGLVSVNGSIVREREN